MSNENLISMEIDNPDNNRFKNRVSAFDDDDEENVENIAEQNLLNSGAVSHFPSVDIRPSGIVKTNPFFLKDSEFYGVINILASAVGGGCFTFPNMLDNSGIFNSLIIFIIVSLSIYYSINLLRNILMSTNLYSYAEIVQKILGKSFLKIYSSFSFIYYLSILIVYINLCYDYISSIIESTKKGFPAFSYFFISSCIEIGLCVFTSNFSKIHILSLIVVITFILIILSVIIPAIFNLTDKDFIYKKFNFEKFFKPKIQKSKIGTLLMVLSNFIQYVYNFSYHCPFPMIIGNLQDKSEKQTTKIHKTSFFILFISYFLISLFGYLSTEEVASVLFQNFRKKIISDILKIDLIVFLISLVPLRYMIIRDGFTSLIGFKEIPYIFEAISASVWIIIANVFVWFYGSGNKVNLINPEYSNISTLIELFGGFFGVFIGFIFPVVIFALMIGAKKKEIFLGYFISGFFFVIGIITCGYSIYVEIKSQKN